MNGKDFITVILAIILFFFECAILFNITSVAEYLFLHTLTIIILSANTYWIYHKNENLLYPLFLLATGLIAGPFGLASFLLMIILRPFYALFASPMNIWFEGLFPEQNLSLFEKIIERIKSHWDDYGRQGETTPFQNLFTYGTLADKQKVLDAIIENFDPSYSSILKEALQDRQNVVRIQAAAIITKLNTDFEEGLKKLEKIHHDDPKDKANLLLLAEYLDSSAYAGILNEFREKEVASLAVRYYRNYLQTAPDDLNVWLAVARLLFYQKDYESFIQWYDEGKSKFKFLPKILISWSLDALYKLKNYDAFTSQLRKL